MLWAKVPAVDGVRRPSFTHFGFFVYEHSSAWRCERCAIEIEGAVNLGLCRQAWVDVTWITALYLQREPTMSPRLSNMYGVDHIIDDAVKGALKGSGELPPNRLVSTIAFLGRE